MLDGTWLLPFTKVRHNFLPVAAFHHPSLCVRICPSTSSPSSFPYLVDALEPPRGRLPLLAPPLPLRSQ